jgi:hypothetical protein
MPLATNSLVTALIIGRIWYISKSAPKILPSKKIDAATAFIIQSGALVVIIQLAFVILFGIESDSQNIAVSMAVQIYVSSQHFPCVFGCLILGWSQQGIAPTLIIFQVGMANAIDEATKTRTVTNFSTHDPAAISFKINKQRNPEDLELGSPFGMTETRHEGPFGATKTTLGGSQPAISKTSLGGSQPGISKTSLSGWRVVTMTLSAI